MPIESPAPATTATGIPTARNVDHFAYTVPDLDQAVGFFVDVLGAELLYTLGPVEDRDTDWMARQLAVHPRASTRIALLRFGPVTNLELFQYTAPGQRTDIPRAVDVGGHRLGWTSPISTPPSPTSASSRAYGSWASRSTPRPARPGATAGSG
ncbi:VOC family protein [Streptomyces sp. MS1.HAVA.3]|uniref:VOC family protein n=1 Tax=Streptomyces caledonius TaxID=3134107 RepID=A0ABU8U2B1_9ACTN